MTRKTKLFTTLAFSGILAFIGALVGTKANNIFGSHAGPCSHEHVEHYVGHTNSETGDGYVEHWACCECHTAWADEGKTIAIGDTIENRTKLDIDYGFEVNWGASKMAPTYDGSTTFTDHNFFISSEGDDPYYYVKTITNKVLGDGEYVEFKIVNNSSANSLNVTILDGDVWTELGIETIVCQKNIERTINFTSDQWNRKPRFLVKEPSKQETSGSLVFKVNFKNASFISDNDEVIYESCAVNSSLNGWASFAKIAEDGEYGEYKVIDIAGAPSGGEFDIIVNGTGGLEIGKYSSVKFAMYNPTQLNIGLKAFMSDSAWGSLNNEDCGILVPGWNIININVSKLQNSSTNFISLRLNFANGGNTNGWRLSKFYGCLKVVTFGENGILLQTEVEAGDDWPSCSHVESIDSTYGKVYTYNTSEFNGDLKNDMAYWVMNRAQLDTVLDGFGSELYIFVPEDGVTYEFAIQDTTSWAQTPKMQLVGGNWNHIVINREFVSGLNFATEGNVAFFRLFGTGSDFSSNEIKMTPIYKREILKTSLKLGTLSDTGTDHEFLGNIYDYARKIDFKGDTGDLNTISYFDPSDFENGLGTTKHEFIFEIYNPNDTDYSIHFAGGAGWTDGSTTILKAKKWTCVTVNEKDVAIGKTGRLYIYVNGMGDQTGWQVTDIWAI